MLFAKPLPLYTKEAPVNVLVFKTNLVTDAHLHDVASCFQDCPRILRWNVDRHDRDNVLRIETNDLLPQEIEKMVREAGYFCEELPD